MLTQKQLQISFFAFNLFTKIGFYPFHLNVKSGKIDAQNPSTTKRCIWWTFLTLTALRALLGTARILFKFGSHAKVPIKEFPLMLNQLGCWAAVYVSLSVFRNNLDATVSVFNYLLTKSTKRTTWRNMTLQELVVLTVVPANIILLPLTYATVLALKPNAVYNFFSALPEPWQTRPVLIGIVAAEACLALYVWSMVTFIAHNMVLFFQKYIEEVDHTLKTFERRSLKVHWLSAAFCIQRALDDMRQLELRIRIYNMGYRHIHFITKITTMFWYIALTAYGILMFHAAPILPYGALFFGNEFAIFYCLIFHKAFAIPRLTNKLKMKLWNFANRSTSGASRQDFRAVIRSVPPTGVQVGNFHLFERMSTPNFLGFGLRNIARIVIAFRNQ